VAAKRVLLLSAALSLLLAATAAHAETLAEALASAYANNPELNAARAGTRAADESVPQALSGYRPRVNAFGTAGADMRRSGGSVENDGITIRSPIDTDTTYSATVGLTVVQPIFSGFRTENGVRAAEAAVKASREQLRNTEQNVLYDAAVAYMNVIRENAILDLRRANVRFLDEQVRAARDRFEVGEGTRTDVAQADAALAAASSAVSLAEANLQAARGFYRQAIGHDPNGLKPGRGVDSLLPKSLETAIGQSRTQHPAILATIHNADTAAFNVKIAEGALLPSLQLEASVSRTWVEGGGRATDNAEILGRLSIPLYQGGIEYSQVREAKETLGQMRIQTDVARDQVHASLIAAWGALDAARAQTVAARAQVEATRLALEGVIEEQRVGQRTTLDVLDAQQDAIDARVSQIQAERDVVVAGYAILSATGRLSRETLGLQVAGYKPEHHYKQVRDKWIGLRTPDGR
jgi:outer membrane protein